MTQLSLVLPTIGQPSSTEDPKTDTAFLAIQTWANGNIDAENLNAATAQSAGLNRGGVVAKGVSVIETEETRSSTSYGLLTTPDQVASVVLPSNGLLVVRYQALWKESVAGAGRAAIFIGSNQLTVQAFNESVGRKAQTQAAMTTSALTNNLAPLFSTPVGLASIKAGGPYSADLTTGQVVGFVDQAENDTTNMEIGGNGVTLGTVHGGLGGATTIFAAAGTYTVSVQFKASSGTVTAKGRRLWVEARSFS